MPVNTAYLESVPTVLSGLSLNGTGSLSALTVTSTTVVSSTVSAATIVGPTISTTGAVNVANFQASNETVSGWLYAGVFLSSATTAASGATSKISQQGQLYFSVLSLTSNGGEFGFRSGNTVYRFASVAVG